MISRERSERRGDAEGRAKSSNDVAARLADVRDRIGRACDRAGRDPSSVCLVAVSKTQPPPVVRAAYDAGQRVFGESYAQELVAKAKEVGAPGIEWHFIGGLQRNKAKVVVEVARVVHSVDRVDLARELDRRAAALGRRLDVFLEVNVAGEASKSGCAPADLSALVDDLGRATALRVVGLMTIPPPVEDPSEARRYFAALRDLRDRHLAALGPGELSMGMSHDFEVAIEEGATVVRVGTAIFGERP